MEDRQVFNEPSSKAFNNNHFSDTANNLEQQFYFGAAVPYGSTFLLVGGGPSSYRDAIHKYIPSNDEWEVMPERLSIAKETRAAMLVHLDMFPSCSADAEENNPGATKTITKYNPDLDPTQSNAHEKK